MCSKEQFMGNDDYLDFISIDELGLSNRASNVLHRYKCHTVAELVKYNATELLELRNLGTKTMIEILDKIEEIKSCGFIKEEVKEAEREACSSLIIDEASTKNEYKMAKKYILNPNYQDTIINFAQKNDVSLDDLGLSVRSLNCLHREGYNLFSEILSLSKDQLMNIRNMGKGSVEEVLKKKNQYIEKYAYEIVAACEGNLTYKLSDEIVTDTILDLFDGLGFQGLSYGEIKERLSLSEEVSDSQLKSVIGRLIANNQLEYVDFRCHRVYPGIEECLELCQKLDDRKKDIFRKHVFEGKTLEDTSKYYNLTRERVRQIVSGSLRQMQKWRNSVYRVSLFDEDYYSFFFESYEIDRKVAVDWLGISPYVIRYLQLNRSAKGVKKLEEALEDENLDIGLRMKIRNYLNKDAIHVDGLLIRRKRADIEQYVLRKYCQNDVSYTEFGKIYNQFLWDNDIPYDENIYFTEAVSRTRENRLSDSRFLLWKLNQQIRYYDIDARDYAEFYNELGLDCFENIEISTLKLFVEHKDLMEQYDLRDHYELHNLLRKTVKEGSFHDFHCERMPIIRFGEFDRIDAFRTILFENAPISVTDLANLINIEYGFSIETILINELKPFSNYLHNGKYVVDQPEIPKEYKEPFQKHLKANFYYIEDLKDEYESLFSNASRTDINPCSLKQLGFYVTGQYAVQGYDSLESYFSSVINEHDFFNINELKAKYGKIGTFRYVFYSLRHDLDIIEYEPQNYVTIRKLNQDGISKEDFKQFCDTIAEKINEGEYFTIPLLKSMRVNPYLFKLGYSDKFYSEILSHDCRFSHFDFCDTTVLCKGELKVNRRTFATSIVQKVGGINATDLINIIYEKYGCNIDKRSEFLSDLKDSLYYDTFSRRFYPTMEDYYSDLDLLEDIYADI